MMLLPKIQKGTNNTALAKKEKNYRILVKLFKTAYFSWQEKSGLSSKTLNTLANLFITK